MRWIIISCVVVHALAFVHIPKTVKLDDRGTTFDNSLLFAASATGEKNIDPLERILDDLYTQSSSIKCPFFKRRAADLIDSLSMLWQFLYIRHKSLDIAFLPTPPGCRALGRHIQRAEDGSVIKTKDLCVSDIAGLIEKDWIGAKEGYTKGYYITGKLNSAIYRDDCFFDGPDPDMPVKGLRKYLDAASKLFDNRESHAEFLGIEYNEKERYIDVQWRLSGILMLPWHPSVKPWTGKTRYVIDNEGLVKSHIETWDISVVEAFFCTLFPDLGNRIWKS